MEETLLDLLSKPNKSIDTFANLTLHTEKGLYMIDEIYIGKAENLINRCWEHVLSPRNGGHNDDLTLYIKNKFEKNEKITFKQICTKIEPEERFIYDYSKYYDLVNKQFAISKKEAVLFKERRQRLLAKAQVKTDYNSEASTTLNEIYGHSSGKNKNEIQVEIIKQIQAKIQFLLNDNRLKDHITENAFNAFMELKNHIDATEMNGQPIPLPPNFFKLEQPEIKDEVTMIAPLKSGKEENDFFTLVR